LPRQSGSQVPPGKPAPPHGGRLRKHRVSNSRKSPRLCYPRLPQQYRPKADLSWLQKETPPPRAQRASRRQAVMSARASAFRAGFVAPRHRHFPRLG
jgi:hypothetical protein